MAAHDWTSHWFNRSSVSTKQSKNADDAGAELATAEIATATVTDTMTETMAVASAEADLAPDPTPELAPEALQDAAVRHLQLREGGLPGPSDRGGVVPTLASTPVGTAPVPDRVTAAVDADLATDLAAITRVVLGIADQPVLVAFPDRAAPEAAVSSAAPGLSLIPATSSPSAWAEAVVEPVVREPAPVIAQPAAQPVGQPVDQELVAEPVAVEPVAGVSGKRAAAVPLDGPSAAFVRGSRGRHAAPVVEEALALVPLVFDEPPTPPVPTFGAPSTPPVLRVDEPVTPLVRRVDHGAPPAAERLEVPRALPESWVAPEPTPAPEADVAPAATLTDDAPTLVPAAPAAPSFELEPAFEGGFATDLDAHLQTLHELKVPEPDDLVMPWVQAVVEPVAPLVPVETEPATRAGQSPASLLRELSFLD